MDEAALDTALTQDEAPFLAEIGLLDIPVGHGRCPGMTASEYLTVQDLAGRWGVSRDTARSYALQEGFPAPLVLTARTIRWPAAEVAAWEDARRAAGRSVAPLRPARRRTPGYIGGPLPAPARVA